MLMMSHHDAVMQEVNTQKCTHDDELKLVDTLASIMDQEQQSPRANCEPQSDKFLSAWDHSSVNLKMPSAQIGAKRKVKNSVLEKSPNANWLYSQTGHAADWPGRAAPSHTPEWKLCVEQRTFRYIPNNGKYRISKLTKKLEIHRNVRRITEKMSPEQKNLQKEIQRELRKEFEALKCNQQPSNDVDNCRTTAITSESLNSGEETKVSASGERGEPPEVTATAVKTAVEQHQETFAHHAKRKVNMTLPPISVPLVAGAAHESMVVPASVHVMSASYRQGEYRDLVTARCVSEPLVGHHKERSPAAIPATLGDTPVSVTTVDRSVKQIVYSTHVPAFDHKGLRSVKPSVLSSNKKKFIDRTVKQTLEVSPHFPRDDPHSTVCAGLGVVRSSKIQQPAVSPFLPEVMGRKITGCTQDII